MHLLLIDMQEARGSHLATAGAPKSGFETAIPIKASSPYVAVEALDDSGTQLGRSPAVRVS